MRDPNRIDDFMDTVGYIWKTRRPYWRFWQFLVNVLGDIDLSYMEDDEMLSYICKYFKTDIETIEEEMYK